ncbi:amidohydrolase [Clostridium sp. UBA871]|uniref:amidohydrolase n=1 Tax=Clostridium sp. UBA871 TaxID=1946380 RepID=UPI003216A6CF
MELRKSIINLRREFHRCAEAGWLEFETTIKIMDYLKKLGYNLQYGKEIHSNPMGMADEEILTNHRIECSRAIKNKSYNVDEILQGYTGVVASIDTGVQGPTMAFRFDIDGLKVEEAKENHRPFKEGFSSKNPGICHCCGHDAHIAMGLQLANTIVEMKEKLTGKIKLIFQPAEEEVRGAKSMVEAGVLKDVDYLFSGHIGFINKNNAIAVKVKNLLATNKVEVEFLGKSAHAGLCPEEGRNALLAGASCILNLHSQVQFGKGVGRLNVGTLHGGTGKNVIADKAVLQLETRGDTNEINDRIMDMVCRVVKGAAISYNVEYNIRVVGSARAYNSTDNEFSKIVIKNLRSLPIEIIEEFSFGASEDITYMLEEVEKQGGKGIYFIIPSSIVAPHHNPYFDFNEESLIIGHDAYVRMIRTFLQKDII